jgi:hypothetical protein
MGARPRDTTSESEHLQRFTLTLGASASLRKYTNFCSKQRSTYTQLLRGLVDVCAEIIKTLAHAPVSRGDVSRHEVPCLRSRVKDFRTLSPHLALHAAEAGGSKRHVSTCLPVRDLDLYIAGTINQAESQFKPFLLMMKVIRAIQ